MISNRSLLILLCCVGVCFAESITISSASEFQGFINRFSSSDVSVDVVLKADIDLSGKLSKPIGVTSNGKCYAYKGTFNGGGYTLKNVVMNTKGSTSGAGLFCSLVGATVNNLKLASSCSFTGDIAGGVAVRASGSTTLTSVNSAATVSGTVCAGGLIGRVEGATSATIKITSSESSGSLSAANSYGWSFIGGFIGEVIDNNGVTVSISKSTRKTAMSLSSKKVYVGGFVGSAKNNAKLSLTINECNNNNNIAATGNTWSSIGGLVGMVSQNPSGSLVLTNNANKGSISSSSYSSNLGGLVGCIDSNSKLTVTMTGNDNTAGVSVAVTTSNLKEPNSVGGLIGWIGYNPDMKLTLTSGMNSGDVKVTGSSGNSYASGLVGAVYSNAVGIVTTSNLNSCENKGGVSTNSGIACGLLCVDPNALKFAKTTVVNSINKGTVSGSQSFGITLNVSSANNVVSMGTVPSSGYSFWSTSSSTSSLYGLNGACVQCSSVNLFAKNGDCYKKTSDNKRVDEELNTVVKSKSYPLLWTKDLDLTESVDPSSSHHNPDPSSSHHNPDPSSSHHNPDPSSSHHNPDPSSSHHNPDPSSSHHNPDPSSSHHNPDPSSSHHTSVSSSSVLLPSESSDFSGNGDSWFIVDAASHCYLQSSILVATIILAVLMFI